MIFFNRFEEKYLLRVGLAVLLVTAFYSKGYHHFDEHFQILEFASLKLGNAYVEDMPWEYSTQMRAAVQPAFVVALHQSLDLVGIDNPFLIATLLRVFSGLSAFGIIIWLLKTFRDEVCGQSYRKWFLPLSLFLWFGVYNAVRFSSENLSALFFVAGFCLALKNQNSLVKFLAAGILLGISFLLRFQSGFMIAGILCWLLFIRKEKWLPLISCGAGIIAAVLLGVLVDRWFYGEWVLSCWNYFNQNILLGKAAGFGVEPWWWYLKEVFLQGIPPFSLLYLAGALLFFYLKPKHPFTFILLPFLLVHFVVAHKEIRFLFPVIYFLPFMIAVAIEQIPLNKKAFLWKIFVKGFWLTNFALLVVAMFRPADNTINLYETIYNNYREPATVFYTDKNPYLRVLNVHWYKRANLSIVKIDSVQQAASNNGNTVLLVTENLKDTDAIQQPHRLVYRGLPGWLKHFNYNGWIDRTRFWYVYELNAR